MKIRGLIWLDEIIDNLVKKHNVSQNEVREGLQERCTCAYLVSVGHDIY